MWLTRYGRLLGPPFLIAGLFVGFAVAEMFADRFELPRAQIGFIGTGLAMTALDCGSRALWSDEIGWRRFLYPGCGASLKLVPAWVLGVLLILAGGIGLLGA